ncbi:MAG: ABC transporter substrate-binding protein [Pseudomonadota bacterium]
MASQTMRGLCGLVLVLVFCGSPVALPQSSQKPQYGGDLNVGTVYVTLSALSWDPADWTWKANHDVGLVREQLFVADLTKSRGQGGRYQFINEAHIPEEVVVGELAERWEWEDPRTLVIYLRRGVHFHGREDIVGKRELDAHDVVFTFQYINNSPKKSSTGFYDYIDAVEARDSHTLVFRLNSYNAEWQYRFGYGYQSSIVPRETSQWDPKDWRNVVGSGPFRLTNYVQGNLHVYERYPNYWGRAQFTGQSYQLPFLDRVKYRVIKDEATYLSALRTGQLDLLENIRWLNVEHLKSTTPELKWSRWLSQSGNFIVMRMDQKPFDDIRVRRALNLAVNQQEILDLFYGGHGELMAYPQHPNFGEYFEPLETMPAEIKELFSYNPEKARALLAEAGYAKGFSFRMQVCSCSPTNMDLIPLLVRYLADVGVEMIVEPLEYGAYLSMMTTKNHGPGYLMNNGHTNPIATLRKFGIGHTWNPALYQDEQFELDLEAIVQMPDEADRIVLARDMTRRLLADAPYVWLPTQYLYTAWWPWVKNYGGELRAGAVRPGPIYARIWIDQTLKKELGFD